MSHDVDRFRTFSRRTFALAGGKALLGMMMLGRLFQLQVLNADKYAVLAEENRINVRLLSPVRRKIFDRFGVAAATNKENYRLILVPEDAGKVDKVLTKVSSIVEITEDDRKRIFRDMKRNAPFAPIIVKEDLSWEQLSKIEVNAPELPGLSIDVGQIRHYPFAAATAHLIGYVGEYSKRDLKNMPKMTLPDVRTGKTGLEKQYNKNLQGGFGRVEEEVNAYGRVLRKLAHKQGDSGEDLYLTIEMSLQDYIQKRIKGLSASVVVMDTKTGDVLGFVSSPSFDPNNFTRGVDAKQWKELMTDIKRPLNNKVLTGQYAPGSTFKMVVALAALENKITSPYETVYCRGHMQIGNRRFHCWKREGHGTVDMRDSLIESCDIYYYDLAKKVGIENIAAMARKLGLGEKTKIAMPFERTGLIPDKAWKRRRFRASWHVGETVLASIGQGYVLTTPIQLAVMTARLASGKAVQPNLIMKTSEEEAAPEFEKLDIKPKHLAVMRDAMAKVVSSSYGTAYWSRIGKRALEMAGKTGTAQVRRISKEEREKGVIKNKDLAWKQRDHALFVGYAPQKNPRYAVSVVVEHGGSGSVAAAPIARDVLKKTQQVMKG